MMNGVLAAGALPLVLSLGGASDVPAATIYQAAVLGDNPILYWTFDEPGSTDNARSLVNDVPANELVASGSASRLPSATTPGGAGLGMAAGFNAEANPLSRFSAADLSPSISLGTFAVEMWISLARSPGDRFISESLSEGGEFGPAGVVWSDLMLLDVAGLQLASSSASSETPVFASSWHHVVAAFYGTGNPVEIHVDGEAGEVLARNGGFDEAHGFGAFSIGNRVAGGAGVVGAVDEYAIYDLSAFPDIESRRAHVARISAHYHVVPEPSSIVMLLVGGAGLFGARIRSRGVRCRVGHRAAL